MQGAQSLLNGHSALIRELRSAKTLASSDCSCNQLVDRLEWVFSNLAQEAATRLSHQIECGADLILPASFVQYIVCEWRSSSVLLHLIFSASDSTLIPFFDDITIVTTRRYSVTERNIWERREHISRRNTRTEILHIFLRSEIGSGISLSDTYGYSMTC